MNIEQLAREAGGFKTIPVGMSESMHVLDAAALARFAALVRAQALGEAAQLVEPGPATDPRDIREDGFEMLVELAAAIRTLKEQP